MLKLIPSKKGQSFLIEKLVPPKHKNRQSAKINSRKNFVARGISEGRGEGL